MIFKHTWLWITVALALLAATVWQFERSRQKSTTQTGFLSHFRPTSVTSVQVLNILPTHKITTINADRTNGGWTVKEQVTYPADAKAIEKLLAAMEHLRPSVYISGRELMTHTNALVEYGFGDPQATLTFNQGAYSLQVNLGSRTAPGDQIFLQVVGDEGIYVVDAGLLSLVPKTADDWRDRHVAELSGTGFDHITITHSGKGFELRKTGTNQWQIIASDFAARADASKVDDLVDRIMALRVERFVPEERRTDLESFGLQSPEFQFSAAQGTHSICTLQFGKALTNDSALVYARNTARDAVLIVNWTNIAPWPTLSSLRDTHLLGGLPALDQIDVQHGAETFKLRRGTNETWLISPQTFALDQRLVKDLLLRILPDLPIADFVKDVVPPQALGEYRLDRPDLQYILHLAGNVTNAGLVTNIVYVQFSTNREDKVFARRSDEPSVYAIKYQQWLTLPESSFQMRDRQIWKFPIEDLVGVVLEQGGTNCHLLRKGDHQWTVAPGSKGAIEPIPVEETLLDLVDLKATAWLPADPAKLNEYGFAKDGQRVTLEFKNGEKKSIDIAPFNLGIGVARVTLEGQTWVFVMNSSLRRDVALYLSVPRQSTL